MVLYFPPELTDLVIHSYAPPSTDGPIDKDAKATLLACGLVSKNWVPASRFLAFSQVTLKCNWENLHSFSNLIASPICSFRGLAREIVFIVPDVRPRVNTPNALQKLFTSILACLHAESIVIEGENRGTKKPILIREQLRLAFTQSFHATRARTAPTSLTLSSLLFESFSDLTLFLRSFPKLVSLRLYNLSFVLSNLSPHLPPQCLEILHIDGSQVVSMMVTWLMSFPQISTSPIRKLVIGDISQSRELGYLVGYVSSSRDVLECFEVKFREGWEVGGWGACFVLYSILDKLNESWQSY
ncbi:hypothetical protein P691DRAFT_429283 [Macrolepiota fuliginosa MF-IS2]|uniref:F-box domain-containing protein n=1 Tax=Macrolepiota fuliginosa MF-IS2 TaxID=1400762 RepID=A0A9P6C3M5_9AGAR|nr:hypothetical protein P691DRAFT_429283 [Macrolepiota fuliginosa MF-IS2]